MQDYRQLWQQLNSGMSGMNQGAIPMPKPGLEQPGAVTNAPPQSFNFLQGWSASPHAGYLPPQQARVNPIQYGTPTQGGWIGGPNGQPIGGSTGMSNPQDMLHDGIKGNYAAWLRQQQGQMGQGILGQLQNKPAQVPQLGVMPSTWNPNGGGP